MKYALDTHIKNRMEMYNRELFDLGAQYGKRVCAFTALYMRHQIIPKFSPKAIHRLHSNRYEFEGNLSFA